MTRQEFKENVVEWYAEVFMRFAVKIWAKVNPNSVDMRTHTFVDGKRILIHIERR